MVISTKRTAAAIEESFEGFEIRGVCNKKAAVEAAFRKSVFKWLVGFRLMRLCFGLLHGLFRTCASDWAFGYVLRCGLLQTFGYTSSIFGIALRKQFHHLILDMFLRRCQ